MIGQKDSISLLSGKSHVEGSCLAEDGQAGLFLLMQLDLEHHIRRIKNLGGALRGRQ